MIWAPIVSGVVSLVSNFFEGRKEASRTKLEIKKIQATAQVERAKSLAQVEADYDLEALRGMQRSWKDEVLTLVLLLPFIGSFIPGVQDHVAAGWGYIGKAPAWYTTSFIGIIAASFGLRWLFGKGRSK